VSVRFKTTGIKKLKLKFNYRKAIPEFLKAMDKSTKDLAKVTQSIVPSKGGKLRKSIENKKAIMKGKKIFGVVFSNRFYAPFLEYGTKKHIISPHKRRKGKGKRTAVKFGDIIRCSVLHPGIKKREYFKKALKKSKKEIMTNFVKAINRIFK